MSRHDRFVVVGLVAQAVSVVSTVASVELTSEPEEIAQARRVRYAELAVGVFTSSLLATVWLAMDDSAKDKAES